MFNFIINFFNKHENKGQPKNEIFSAQYRASYNKLWINQLREYYP